MKKIMFNDRYGLTKAVLNGTKTMTRRIIPEIWVDFPRSGMQKANIRGLHSQVLMMDFSHVLGEDCLYPADSKYQPKYYKGDEVAVAQSYKDIDERGIVGYEDASNIQPGMVSPIFAKDTIGWSNKMFVKAELMPNRIIITNIKLERLQDISEEDAMKEGVFKYEKPPLHHECDMYAPWPPYVKAYKYDCDNLQYRCNARAAFADLIDRISGKGTWDLNPWVYAYEFELIK